MLRRSPHAALLALALLACGEPEPVSDKVVERRRAVLPGTHEPEQDSWAEPAEAPASEPEARDRDPKIARALTIIRTSKLRFLAPEADDPTSADEYTAEQFVSMLESKRDWIGYDIVDFDPWLAEVATCSFLDRVPYVVVLDDGSTRELRPWLLERMAEPPSLAPAGAP
ncbi:hypothetical protein ACNOYE_36760 [Nannocystaceae bacterium ST9]